MKNNTKGEATKDKTVHDQSSLNCLESTDPNYL
jgi:hypothetical protein